MDLEKQVGDEVQMHFVWKLPNEDYLRAIFRTEVVAILPDSKRYLLLLQEWVAGRQESPTGEMRPEGEVLLSFWRLVDELVGHKAAVAYEAVDGRALPLRLTTLLRIHPFFTRYDDAVVEGLGGGEEEVFVEADSTAVVQPLPQSGVEGAG
jgi:hypothetical protein